MIAESPASRARAAAPMGAGHGRLTPYRWRARSEWRHGGLAVVAVAASAACFTALEIRNGGLGANLYGILGAARTLLSGRPPTALNLISYPATTFPLYAPLALLPDRVAQPLTQVGSLALLAAVLFAWGRSDGERPTAWLAALLFSPPAIGLVWIDQVNTAVALASLSAAVFLVNGPRRSVAGALGAVTLVLRPFNAIPALPALGFLHRRSRRLAVAVLWCCIVTGAVALVAWRWDGSLIHDLLNTASRRPISGVAGFARQLLGLPGLLGYLAALLAFEIWLARALEPTHSRLDSAAILIAVSVLGVHLGGNYPAVYCFPALARLTARSPSPAWPVAFTVLYAAIAVANGLTLPMLSVSILAQLLVITKIFLPVLAALICAWGLAAAAEPGRAPAPEPRCGTPQTVEV